jgi:hypothetical protein
MSNIEDSLWYVARSIRNETLIEFSEEQQELVKEMIRNITKSELLQPDFNSVDYCWYGIESNVKRKALDDSIGEDYTIIYECLEGLYGDFENFEKGINEKYNQVLEFSEEVVDEIESTSNITYKMGINVQLSEALLTYRSLIASFLVYAYDNFRLDIEGEFYQFLQSILNSRVS